MAVSGTSYNFKSQTAFYKGKVRDVYTLNDELLIMVASDRISAFDVVLPKAIPYKGQVLNQVAGYFLEATRNLVPNWLLAQPHPMVSIGRKCEPLRVEMVIRGYMSGHAAREYKAGRRVLCGVSLPENMKENQAFPSPIITPSTKAEHGHDEDISREQIIQTGLVQENVYAQMEAYTRQLFEKGTQMAADRGLILVDTKYEFGLLNNQVTLMDEIHTPDSSRYFYAEGYHENLQKDLPPKQLSKEFVRQWLIENGFQGKEGQVMPEMSDAWVETISERYIELFEKVTGHAFERASEVNQLPAIESAIQNWLKANYY